MITYRPLDHSNPRTVSEREIGPWTGHTVCMLIRLRHVSWSRRNESRPGDCVARYSMMRIVTSPNWIAPRHIARAMRDLLADGIRRSRAREPRRAMKEYASGASPPVAAIVASLAGRQR